MHPQLSECDCAAACARSQRTTWGVLLRLPRHFALEFMRCCFANWFVMKPLSGMDCEGRGVCGMSSCPGGLTCFSHICFSKPNSLVHLGYAEGSRLRVHISSVPGIGLTVTSLTNFRKGDSITVYDGYLLHRSQSLRASDSYARTLAHTCAFDDYIIHGLQVPVCGRGVGSFINHCYNSNCCLRPLFAPWPYYGQGRSSSQDLRVLVVVAKTDISPGEELSLRYDKHICSRLAIPYHQ